MKDMRKLKEMLERELQELGEKGSLSAGDVDTIHKIASSIKNLCKIEMYAEEEEYSNRGYGGGSSRRGGNWQAEGEYGDSYEDGMSGARRGMHYVRGHYSRDDDHSSRRRYSRDDGKESMMVMLDEMMEHADSDKQRQAIHRCREELSLV